jgi:hypothetical protein
MKRTKPRRTTVTAAPVGEILTTTQAAKILGVKPRALVMWRYQKKGPPYFAISKKCVRYSLPALLDWLRQYCQHPGAVA